MKVKFSVFGVETIPASENYRESKIMTMLDADGSCRNFFVAVLPEGKKVEKGQEILFTISQVAGITKDGSVRIRGTF